MHGIKTKIPKLLLHTKFAAVAHLRKGNFLLAVGYRVKFVILQEVTLSSSKKDKL
jgi:hypothetical protein